MGKLRPEACKYSWLRGQLRCTDFPSSSKPTLASRTKGKKKCQLYFVLGVFARRASESQNNSLVARKEIFVSNLFASQLILRSSRSSRVSTMLRFIQDLLAVVTSLASSRRLLPMRSCLKRTSPLGVLCLLHSF